jgi:hypothetical protein
MTLNNSRHDRLLMSLLAILNVGSGITTVQGAMQIFPNGIGVFSGIAIQMILFLLLANLIIRHAPARKWVAVLICAFISVYTSFFSYYDTLAGESQKAVLLDQAFKAHQDLKQQVYVPLESKLTQLKGSLSFSEAQAIKEKSGQGVTGEEGFGDVARSHAEDAEDAQKEIADLEPVVNSLKPKFDDPATGVSPEEILKLDREALGSVPKQFLPENYQQNPELDRKKYVDETSTIKLLVPFYKVVHKEPPAIGSFAIAAMVDGMIIMLGTAVDSSQRKAPFEAPAQFVAAIIAGAKGFSATVDRALTTKVGYFPQPRPDQVLEPRQAIEYINLRLSGRASTFLEEFQDSIHPRTYVIDYERLHDNANLTFASGSRILLEALRNPKIQWIDISHDEENNVEEWFVFPNHYASLMIWLNDEIVRQAEQEKKEGSSVNFRSNSNSRTLLRRFQLPIPNVKST